MKKVKIIMVMTMAILFAFAPMTSYAATATTTASVSATIPSVTTVSLTRDSNSVTRGSATQILFDKRDDQDMTGGDAGYMYAPYRSETGKNWHVASIAANGSTLSLDVSVTGTVGTTPLVNILKIWCGGFFTPGSSTPITGTNSTDWEWANGWQRTLSQPFTGTASFNYQLNIADITAGGPYSGNITFTLTTT